MSTKEKIQEEVAVLEKEIFQHEIVLHNDDVNTFDHVINSLIEVCEHTLEQAEQCAMLVHYKGKCTVKSGSEIVLIPICETLTEKGLSAVLEEL